MVKATRVAYLFLTLFSVLGYGKAISIGPQCAEGNADQYIVIRNDYSKDLTIQISRQTPQDRLEMNWYSYVDLGPGNLEKIALCQDGRELNGLLFKEKGTSDAKYTQLDIKDFLSGKENKGIAMSASYFGFGAWSVEGFDLAQEEFQEIDDPEKTVFSAGWNDITFQRRQELKGPSYVHIKKALYYVSDPVTGYDAFFNKSRVVLFVFHGTFAVKDPQFFSLDDNTFQAFKNYAQSLGNSVELVSIGWSGDNENTSRQQAYEYVKFIFEKLYSTPILFIQINMLGYSHGGNIVNLITKDTYFSDKIHNIFSIYTPVRDDYKANADAITGKLYHFYSTADPIQYGGSFKQADFSYQSFTPWWEKLGLPRMGAGFEGGRKIATAYEEKIEQQKAINYRVMVNGHSPTHLNIKPVVQYLQEIIQKTQELYRYNFDLELNIDTKNGEIDLAIRHPFSPDLVEDDAIEEALEKEKRMSEKAEAQFKKKYGADIHTKSSLKELIYSPFVSKVQPVYPTMLFGRIFDWRTV